MKKSLIAVIATLLLSGCAQPPAITYYQCMAGDEASCLAMYQLSLNGPYGSEKLAAISLKKMNDENQILVCTPTHCTSK